MTRHNSGIVNTGSGSVVNNGIVGDRGTMHVDRRAPAAANGGRHRETTAPVGVITVLSAEMRAVAAVLRHASGYTERVGPGGRRFYQAAVENGTATTQVVATQAAVPGQRSAVVAFEQLQRFCAPSVVVLCGIAGRLHENVRLGDVVIGREIIYYEHRKETPDGIRRRGQSQAVPVGIQHAVNDMFTALGEPLRFEGTGPDGATRDFYALSGPIGTGEAVIAYGDAEIRDYLRRYNDKTLALETEAGGVAQAFYEQVADERAIGGWLAVRGISDHADASKDDSYHDVAARNAATVLALLLPYLLRTA